VIALLAAALIVPLPDGAAVASVRQQQKSGAMATMQLAIRDASRMTVFSLQARPRDARSWLQLAQRCEESGFDALLASDHPGSGASPFVALAAAAAVTSTLGLGSYVSNTGVREPVLLAADVATLDVVPSGGCARTSLAVCVGASRWPRLSAHSSRARTST